MKTITIELGGKLRSLVVPGETAAFLQAVDYESGVCNIYLRMKKISEHSSLTSFKAAQREFPSKSWRPCSPTSWVETAGGLPDSENPYYKLVLVFRDNEWNLVVTDAMTEFRNVQRDVLAVNAQLPRSNQAAKDDIKQALELLSKAQGGGRW